MNKTKINKLLEEVDINEQDSSVPRESSRATDRLSQIEDTSGETASLTDRLLKKADINKRDSNPSEVASRIRKANYSKEKSDTRHSM